VLVLLRLIRFFFTVLLQLIFQCVSTARESEILNNKRNNGLNACVSVLYTSRQALLRAVLIACGAAVPFVFRAEI
jgi:hypothetical protein